MNREQSEQPTTSSEFMVQVGYATVDSLRDLATKAVCKRNNDLAEKVRAINSEKDIGPIFSEENLFDEETCKHYTGFPNHAVFIAVFNLLNPGTNGENVRLVSAPNAHSGRGRKRSLNSHQQFLHTLTRLRRGFFTEHLG